MDEKEFLRRLEANDSFKKKLSELTKKLRKEEAKTITEYNEIFKNSAVTYDTGHIGAR